MRLINATLLAILAAAPVYADGRLEINQATVEATGGFPFEIAESGSYVLTGNLVVTEAEVNAISITASEGFVAIDLNGFRIEGPHLCAIGGCSSGAASGIGLGTPFVFAAVTVKNGDVTGFSGDCIVVPNRSRVENVRVTGCGRNGIAAGSRSRIIDNDVSATGEHGIELFDVDGGAYAQNTVWDSDLAEGGHAAIVGGRATAGNVCRDGTCSNTLRRRFYLSAEKHAGNEVMSACADGYHMASLWEIHDPTALQYDRTLGFTDYEDQGSGPPDQEGWIRTGSDDDTTTGSLVPGVRNCNAWTTASAEKRGTTALLRGVWNDESGVMIAPWRGFVTSCAVEWYVWCVED